MSSIRNISLFIPHVFANFSKEYVQEVMEELMQLGKVSRVDFVSKVDKNGKSYNAAYIHFQEWNDTPRAISFQARVLSPTIEARIVYDKPWFWIVLENKQYNKENEDKPTTTLNICQLIDKIIEPQPPAINYNTELSYKSALLPPQPFLPFLPFLQQRHPLHYLSPIPSPLSSSSLSLLSSKEDEEESDEEESDDDDDDEWNCHTQTRFSFADEPEYNEKDEDCSNEWNNNETEITYNDDFSDMDESEDEEDENVVVYYDLEENDQQLTDEDYNRMLEYEPELLIIHQYQYQGEMIAEDDDNVDDFEDDFQQIIQYEEELQFEDSPLITIDNCYVSTLEEENNALRYDLYNIQSISHEENNALRAEIQQLNKHSIAEEENNALRAEIEQMRNSYNLLQKSYENECSKTYTLTQTIKILSSSI